jgi:hypothetical protein
MSAISKGEEWLRQSECNVGDPLRPFRISCPAGSDHDVLSTVDHVGTWSGCSRIREIALPQELARLGVEGAQLAVIDRRANEQDTAGGQNRATVVLRAGVRHSLRNELGVLAERDLPEIFTRVQVDCIEL